MRRLALAFVAASMACLPEDDAKLLFRAGIAEMPVEKFGPVGGFVNGRLFVLGGPTGWGDGRFHVYDFDSNVWSTGPSLNGTAEWEGAKHGDQLFVCGYHPTGPELRCQRWGADDGWVPIASPSGPRAGFTMVATDQHVYLIGGYESSTGEYGTSVDRFDPVSGTWTRMSPLPFAMQWGWGAYVNGRIWLFSHDPAFQTAGVDSYEPDGDTWTREASELPTFDLWYSRSGVALDGAIWTVSSPYEDSLGPSLVWRFDPSSREWETRGSMPEPVWFPWIGTDGTQIWVIGGETLRQSGEPVARAEAFLP